MAEIIYVPHYSGGASDSKRSKKIASLSDIIVDPQEIEQLSLTQTPFFVGGNQVITLHTIDAVMRKCAKLFNPTDDIKRRYDKNVLPTVLYLDSHADLNNEQSSPTGNPHGMVLNMQYRSKRNVGLIPYSHIVFYGLKDVDSYESELIRSHEIENYSVLQMPDLQKGYPLYLAIDMDCLKLEQGVSYPYNSGYTAEEVVQFIDMIDANYNVVGAELVEYIPDLDQDRSVFDDCFMPIFNRLKQL